MTWPLVRAMKIFFSNPAVIMANFSIVTTGLYNSMSPFNITLLTLYVIMVVIGLIGNSFVVIIVWKTTSMHTTTNFLLTNVAIADIISLLWCLIPLASSLSGKHPRGQVGTYICKFFTGYAVTSISVSVKLSSLFVLAIERYRAVLKPLENNLQLRQQYIGHHIAFSWIFAAIYSLPGFIYSEYDERLQRCLDPWTMERVATVKWLVITTAVLMTICSICLFCCYFQILKGIYITNTVCPEIAATRQADMKAKRKLAIVSLTVTAAYIICNTPFLVFEIYAAYTGHEKIVNNYETLYRIYRVLGYIIYFNSCLNPFLYGFQSSNYRRHFQRIFLHRPLSPGVRNINLQVFIVEEVVDEKPACDEK